MNFWKLLPFVLFLSCQGQPSPSDAGPPPPPPPSASAASVAPVPTVTLDASGAWSLHFSPNGGCEDAVATFIGTATSSVHLMAYGFTSEKVANALIAKKASGHGLDVEAVLDKSDKTAKGSLAAMLKNGNVPVFIDSKHAIMHDKYIVVDGKGFETGSFNYTNAAEHSNAENCLIEEDHTKAQVYEANFQLHKAHSEALPYSN